MTMTEPSPMKPADQTNYLLGELSGKLGSLQQSVETSYSAQSQINATNETEHAEFRRAIADLTTGQAVILAGQKPKSPWFSVVGGIAGILASVVSTVAVFTILTKITTL